MSIADELSKWQWTIAGVREELNFIMRAGKYSAGLAVELAHHRVDRVYDTHRILDEIAYLEGDNRRSTRTPPPELFKGPILRGYWKKQHYQDAFMLRNLKNEVSRKGTPLDKLLHKLEGNYVDAVAGQIAHEAVVGLYLHRAAAKRMTGEYIIYERTKRGSNYYLTLGLHNDDERTKSRIEIYKELDLKLLSSS